MTTFLSSTEKDFSKQIQKVLELFHKSKEWGDLIRNLHQLSKVLQSYNKIKAIPHKFLVAKQLSLCLNNDLPWGVHLKTIEIYAQIFQHIGHEILLKDFPVYSVGLFPAFQYSSNQVRLSILKLLERFVIPFGKQLDSILKGLIVAVLPGLEEEDAEISQRTLLFLQEIEQKADFQLFYVHLFKTMISNPKQTQNIINYLNFKFDLKSNNPKKQNFSIILENEFLNKILVESFVPFFKNEDILVLRKILDFITNQIPLRSKYLTREQKAQLLESCFKIFPRKDSTLKHRIFLWLDLENQKEIEEIQQLILSSFLRLFEENEQQNLKKMDLVIISESMENEKLLQLLSKKIIHLSINQFAKKENQIDGITIPKFNQEDVLEFLNSLVEQSLKEMSQEYPSKFFHEILSKITTLISEDGKLLKLNDETKLQIAQIFLYNLNRVQFQKSQEIESNSFVFTKESISHSFFINYCLFIKMFHQFIFHENGKIANSPKIIDSMLLLLEKTLIDLSSIAFDQHKIYLSQKFKESMAIVNDFAKQFFCLDFIWEKPSGGIEEFVQKILQKIHQFSQKPDIFQTDILFLFFIQIVKILLHLKNQAKSSKLINKFIKEFGQNGDLKQDEMEKPNEFIRNRNLLGKHFLSFSEFIIALSKKLFENLFVNKDTILKNEIVLLLNEIEELFPAEFAKIISDELTNIAEPIQGLVRYTAFWGFSESVSQDYFPSNECFHLFMSHIHASQNPFQVSFIENWISKTISNSKINKILDPIIMELFSLLMIYYSEGISNENPNLENTNHFSLLRIKDLILKQAEIRTNFNTKFIQHYQNFPDQGSYFEMLLIISSLFSVACLESGTETENEKQSNSFNNENNLIKIQTLQVMNNLLLMFQKNMQEFVQFSELFLKRLMIIVQELFHEIGASIQKADSMHQMHLLQTLSLSISILAKINQFEEVANSFSKFLHCDEFVSTIIAGLSQNPTEESSHSKYYYYYYSIGIPDQFVTYFSDIRLKWIDFVIDLSENIEPKEFLILSDIIKNICIQIQSKNQIVMSVFEMKNSRNLIEDQTLLHREMNYIQFLISGIHKIITTNKFQWTDSLANIAKSKNQDSKTENQDQEKKKESNFLISAPFSMISGLVSQIISTTSNESLSAAEKRQIIISWQLAFIINSIITFWDFTDHIKDLMENNQNNQNNNNNNNEDPFDLQMIYSLINDPIFQKITNQVGNELANLFLYLNKDFSEELLFSVLIVWNSWIGSENLRTKLFLLNHKELFHKQKALISIIIKTQVLPPAFLYQKFVSVLNVFQYEFNDVVMGQYPKFDVGNVQDDSRKEIGNTKQMQKDVTIYLKFTSSYYFLEIYFQYLIKFRKGINLNQELLQFLKEIVKMTQIPTTLFILFRAFKKLIRSLSNLPDDKKLCEDLRDFTKQLLTICFYYTSDSFQLKETQIKPIYFVHKNHFHKIQRENQEKKNEMNNLEKENNAKIENKKMTKEEKRIQLIQIQHLIHQHLKSLGLRSLSRSGEILHLVFTQESQIISILNSLNVPKNHFPYIIRNEAYFSQEILKILSHLSKYPEMLNVWKKNIWEIFMSEGFFPIKSQTITYWKEIVISLIKGDESLIDELLQNQVNTGVLSFVGNLVRKDRENEEVLLKIKILQRLAFIVLSSSFNQLSFKIEQIKQFLIDCLKLKSSSNLIKLIFLILQILIYKMDYLKISTMWQIILPEMMKIFSQNIVNQEIVFSGLKLLDFVLLLIPEHFQIFDWIFFFEKESQKHLFNQEIEFIPYFTKFGLGLKNEEKRNENENKNKNKNKKEEQKFNNQNQFKNQLLQIFKFKILMKQKKLYLHLH
ncbi:dopey-related [Anaeramoeba ignava]|uniref:Dopey-related n=1 Tax=Anaeramoeba ignava TaxID=1746090 RepID=A0A9Q0R4F9_ANAIG|nr:dopey-related [Anaeramoeba ignava]